MAFNKRALSRMATSQYASGESASAYFMATANAAAAVIAAGYLNDARDMLRVGDIIFASVGIGGTADTLLIRVATVPASRNITTVAETGASGS